MAVIVNGAVVFLNVGITFVTFKLLGNLPDENDKFAISDIDLLRTI